MKISSTKRQVIPLLREGTTEGPSSQPKEPRASTSFLQAGSAAVVGTGAGLVAFTDFVTTDKVKHMGVTGGATLALTALGVKPGLAAATVFGGATIGKELILDKLLGQGTASWLDTAANLSGVLAAVAIVKFGQGVSELTAPRRHLAPS